MIARNVKPAWVEGAVDTAADHIKICYGERQTPVALLARTVQKVFTVQFLIGKRSRHRLAGKMLDEVCRELDFYLLYAVGPDSWTFVQYHCDTAANRRSIVHWSWHPKE